MRNDEGFFKYRVKLLYDRQAVLSCVNAYYSALLQGVVQISRNNMPRGSSNIEVDRGPTCYRIFLPKSAGPLTPRSSRLLANYGLQ